MIVSGTAVIQAENPPQVIQILKESVNKQIQLRETINTAVNWFLKSDVTIIISNCVTFNVMHYCMYRLYSVMFNLNK